MSERMMDRRTWIWVVVGGVLLMALGFYLSAVLNLSAKTVSLGAPAAFWPS